VVDNWEKIKAGEKASTGKASLGIPDSLPALMRGYRMLARLSRAEQPRWNDLRSQIVDCSRKHQLLLEQLSDGGTVPAEDFGELMLGLVNLARLKGYHAETCLHEALSRLAAAGE
jgi:uncharacterized protein YabN with tetrapyrrole methylase and pyrophosphatase domain